MATDPLYTQEAGGSTLSPTARESFEDRITIFSPQDTPLQMLLPTRPVSNIRSSWMADDIATPTTVQTVTEGFEFVDITDLHTTGGPDSNPNLLDQQRRTRIYNDVAPQAQPVVVTDSNRNLNEAGITEEFAYQLSRAYLKLAKQTETNLWHSIHTDRAAPAAASLLGTGTAGTTVGFLQWAIELGIPRIGDPGTGTYTGQPQVVGPNSSGAIPEALWTVWYHNTTTAAGIGSGTGWVASTDTLTRSGLIDNVLQPYWDIGGDITSSILFVSGPVKKHLSDMGLTYTAGGQEVPLQRSMIAQESRRNVMAVDVFETDFGDLHIVLSRYLQSGFADLQGTIEHSSFDDPYTIPPEGIGFGMDPRYCRIMEYRPMDWVPVAKTGDNTKAFVRSECGTQPDSPMALWGFSSAIDDT